MRYFTLVVFTLLLISSAKVFAGQKNFEIELCSEVFEYKAEVYFCGKHRRYGKELFRSNGSPEGTRVVADIDLGPGGSSPREFFILGDKLYFFAENTLTGREIWRTDGTQEGTKRISDAYPGPGGFPFDLGYIHSGDQVVYFDTPDGVWRTDGSYSGTEIVTNANFVFSMSGSLYFFENDNEELKLYRLPENSLLAELVKNFGVDCRANRIGRIDKTVVGNKFYFSIGCAGNESQNGAFVSDGTTSGTNRVIDGSVNLLGDLNGYRFFYNRTSNRIQYTNGVATNTLGICGSNRECHNASSETRSQFDGSSMVFNGRLIFSLSEKGHISGRVWATDGTLNGTVPLTEAGSVFNYVKNRHRVLFRYDPGRLTNQVVVTDGTVNGTRVLKSIPDGFASGIYSIGSVFLMFLRNPSSERYELWVSSGAPSTNRRIASFKERHVHYQSVVEGNRFYFPIDGLLWHTNGRSEGTYKVTYIDDVEDAVEIKYPLAAIIDLLLNSSD